MLEFLNRVWTHISAQSPAVIVITTFAMFVIFMLWYETYKQRLDWRDLITNPATNRVSLTKVLQLVGGVVGTWIMVVVTLHDKLSAEIFFTYLAYVGAIEGWSKYITARYNPGDAINPAQRLQVGRYGNRGYDPYPQSGYDGGVGYDPRHTPITPTAPISAKPPIGDDV